MANHTTNDRGELVLAIGVPGSIVRAGIEYPEAIKYLDELYARGAEIEEALEYLKQKGINSTLERGSIIHHTMFKQ